MLLLDDDDELPASPDKQEAALVTRLSSQGLQAVDAELISRVGRTWRKVARVVIDTLQAGGLSVDENVVRLHVRRVGELVRAGRLEAQGNLRRPRFCEVRLPTLTTHSAS